MPLGDVANRDLLSIAICYDAAEPPFALEHAFGMMINGPVTEVAKRLLGGIQKVMDRKIVFRHATEKAGRRLSVIPGMCHARFSSR